MTYWAQSLTRASNLGFSPPMSGIDSPIEKLSHFTPFTDTFLTATLIEQIISNQLRQNGCEINFT